MIGAILRSGGVSSPSNEPERFLALGAPIALVGAASGLWSTATPADHPHALVALQNLIFWEPALDHTDPPVRESEAES
jgi:hypothetical protein